MSLVCASLGWRRLFWPPVLESIRASSSASAKSRESSFSTDSSLRPLWFVTCCAAAALIVVDSLGWMAIEYCLELTINHKDLSSLAVTSTFYTGQNDSFMARKRCKIADFPARRGVYRSSCSSSSN